MIAGGIISDTHNHNWAQFSKQNPDGVNSRLAIILEETWRAAEAIKNAGGKYLIHGGDLFHVRGSIAPSVMNPTYSLYAAIALDLGLKVFILSGNHDLESKDAEYLTSATSTMGYHDGVTLINRVTYNEEFKLIMIPYMPDLASLRAVISNEAEKVERTGRFDFDLIIHAPVNNVIPGIPDTGLDPLWLNSLPFNRIFAGHYHSHKRLGVKTYSIGALTHQTWSDVGTKAGFLTIDSEQVYYNASHAPEFLDLPADIDQDEIPLLVDGNYVRARIETDSASDVEELRNFLYDNGAAGVSINVQKKTAVTSRVGSTVKAGADLKTSIKEYIDSKALTNASEVNDFCLECLDAVESSKDGDDE